MNTGRDSGICKYVGKREKEEKNINFLIINLKTFQDEKEFVYEYACNGRYAICDLMFARRIA